MNNSLSPKFLESSKVSSSKLLFSLYGQTRLLMRALKHDFRIFLVSCQEEAFAGLRAKEPGPTRLLGEVKSENVKPPN